MPFITKTVYEAICSICGVKEQMEALGKLPTLWKQVRIASEDFGIPVMSYDDESGVEIELCDQCAETAAENPLIVAAKKAIVNARFEGKLSAGRVA
jgi:hypothetical protein